MVNRRDLRLHVATGLLLGWAAFLLVHEAFHPYTFRFRLEGSDRTQAFSLPAREPLFLEYELVARAPGRDRPAILVTLNDHSVAIPPVTAAYSTLRANVPLPFAAIRSGTNVLRVRVGGAGSNTFEMRGRVHNYQRLASKLPSAVVVADDAVTHRRTQASVLANGAILLASFALSIAGVWLLGGVGLRWSARWPAGHVLLLVIGPLAAVLYGVGRPLHVWLSPAALAVLAIVPWLLVQSAAWIVAHRRLVFAVVAPIVLTCVALEGALRLYNAVSPTYVFYSESLSRFRGKPGERRFDAAFNSRGFYDVERTLARPADVSYRIVALGDSFAVGVVPLRDSFLTRLETLLSETSRTEVINMGVAGTNPPEYLSLLAHEGLAYRPDLVLVNVFVGNDLETRAPRWYERSYLTTLARVLWRLGRSPAVTVLPSDEHLAYDDNAPGMHPDQFMEVEVDRSWVYERDSARVREAVARAAGEIQRMRDLARRDRADLVAVLIPGEIQIDGDLRTQVVAARDAFAEQFDWEQPNRLLTHALEQADIEVVDLLPAIADAAQRERVYKRNDTHWNLKGNAVAADAIARALLTRVARAK